MKLSRAGPLLDIVVAVNDEAILSANLLRSPNVAEGRWHVLPYRGARCASQAYAAGFAESSAPLVAFVHQDVYLPASWPGKLAEALAWLDAHDPEWGLLACYGVTASGDHVGRVWCSSLRRQLGSPLPHPVPVESVDELAFIVRRGAGSPFDPDLPHFHLYGTDAIQTLKRTGHRSYVADFPVVHNTRPVLSLAGGYTRAYRYMQTKWRAVLPLHTTIVTVSRAGLPLLKHRIRRGLSNWRRGIPAPLPPLDARQVALNMGYELAVPEAPGLVAGSAIPTPQ